MMGIMKKDDTPGLFSAFADRPLADRLRPSALEDIMGQDHLLGEGGPLRLMADSGKMTSFILWGPPGCGKTTLARILATPLISGQSPTNLFQTRRVKSSSAWGVQSGLSAQA